MPLTRVPNSLSEENFSLLNGIHNVQSVSRERERERELSGLAHVELKLDRASQ